MLSDRSSEFFLDLSCVPGSVPDCYNLLRFPRALLALCGGGRCGERRGQTGQPGVRLGAVGPHERGGGQQQCGVCVGAACSCVLLVHRPSGGGFQTASVGTGKASKLTNLWINLKRSCRICKQLKHKGNQTGLISLDKK